MRIAKVIGKVVLSRSHSSFEGANLKLAVPYTLDNLDGTSDQEEDAVVAWDQLGTHADALIGLAEGPEAAQPFRPELKPVDAYVASILDSIDLHEASITKIRNAK